MPPTRYAPLLDWTPRWSCWETEERERRSAQRSGWSLSAAHSGDAFIRSSPPPLPLLISRSLFTCRSRRSAFVGRGPTKRSGSNLRQWQITQRRRGDGGASASNGGALFIHLLYLGYVTDSTRNSVALMCCLNTYRKRWELSGFTKCHTRRCSYQRKQVAHHPR